jgi:hypothetical protein
MENGEWRMKENKGNVSAALRHHDVGAHLCVRPLHRQHRIKQTNKQTNEGNERIGTDERKETFIRLSPFSNLNANYYV